MQPRLRQAALFVAVSGAGWVLDTALFLLLSGPGGWHVVAANMVSGSAGALLVFMVSSRGLFRRNAGPMPQKVGVLLGFNAAVILISSVVLGAIAVQLAAAASRMGLAVGPDVVRLAAKVLVTPVTLALNFIVVRYLLEQFVGVKGGGVKGEGLKSGAVR